MKKTFISDYTSIISKDLSGESYKKIVNYFYPEFITALILYFVINFLDSLFISRIQISYYETLGITNTLIHFITKIAESFSVGVLVICGQLNSVGQYKEVGKSVTDSFWSICLIGGFIAGFLYFAAPWIYDFYEVPADMKELGVPFLRLRAIGIFFNFVFFALVGFFRGIKNTKAPMFLFIIGALVFAFFDYVLIFGKLGFSPKYFKGSALASIIQYAVMLFCGLIYILLDPEIRKYSPKLFSAVKITNILKLINLSWPVMIDKASIAMCHIWLAKMIACMAKLSTSQECHTILASFSVLKDIERFSMLPAIAFAQVITFLVSNDYKLHKWERIKVNIRKIMLLSAIMVFGLLFVFSLYPRFFIKIIDNEEIFVDFAAKLIPAISIFVFFDLIQLILSAVLRGAADVKTVMYVRVIISLLFFVPASYFLSFLPIQNLFLKFILIYGSFYISTGLMSIIYIYRFKTDQWKKLLTEKDINAKDYS